MNDLKDIREMRIFDYLEGNLSESEISEFDNDLSNETNLEEELSEWEKAYLVADDYDTIALEANIIKSTFPRYSILRYLNIFLVFSIIFVSGHEIQSGETAANNSLNSFEKNSIDIYQPNRRIPINNQKKVPKALSSIQELRGVKQNKEVNTKIKALEKEFQTAFVLAINHLELKPYGYGEMKLITFDKLTPSSKSVKRKLSRQEIKYRAKQIRKFKAKELQRRQAVEFMKGNTPYVVPIDMKRF